MNRLPLKMAKPKLVVFDLDYTFWPFFVDTHVSPPFTQRADGKVYDTRQAEVKHYPDVPQVLQKLKSEGIKIAAASRTTATKDANTLLQMFDFDKYFDYKEIYPGSKTAHFKKFKQYTGFEYKDMLFFDDEHRNIRDISKLGVSTYLVHRKKGLTMGRFENGLAIFSGKQPQQITGKKGTKMHYDLMKEESFDSFNPEHDFFMQGGPNFHFPGGNVANNCNPFWENENFPPFGFFERNRNFQRNQNFGFEGRNRGFGEGNFGFGAGNFGLGDFGRPGPLSMFSKNPNFGRGGPQQPARFFENSAEYETDLHGNMFPSKPQYEMDMHGNIFPIQPGPNGNCFGSGRGPRGFGKDMFPCNNQNFQSFEQGPPWKRGFANAMAQPGPRNVNNCQDSGMTSLPWFLQRGQAPANFTAEQFRGQFSNRYQDFST